MTWIKTNRATGIGSLPHADIASALQLVSHTFPHWPHWPQLPLQCDEQGFVVQYVQPLLKLGLLQVAPDKELFFARAAVDWDDKRLRFYELYFAFQAGDPQAAEFFALEPSAFSGLDYFLTNFAAYFPLAEGVKGQISGPLTVGLQIKDEQGQAAFYNKMLLDLLVKCITVQGMIQARKLQSTGLPVLLFIDDPCLFLLGTTTHITLTRAAVAAALTEILQPLTATGVKVGVHVCAQADWSVLFDLPLDVISFDAYNFFPSMAAQSQGLQNFLLKGGKMAWGLVPTAEDAWKVTPADLARLFEQQCSDLNKCLDVSLLRRNLIWTPSCGTGALTPELGERIYCLLAELVQLTEKS
ncbi:MAG TPA: hypothetical protein VGL27_19305 [Negativicutes bacterium]|jgi:hypothetical protein